MKHFLKLLDVTTEEIYELLDLAATMKQYVKEGKEHHFLKGKTLGMIFEKSSTRTRISFETGMFQLGGHALFISAKDSQIGRGEPTQDTARVMSRMLDGIMIRTFEQSEVEMLAEYGSIPVINGLTDFCHPCQVMADLLTIREHKGKLEGLTMCYIGDGNNMSQSLPVGALKCGMEVALATPKAYRPRQEILDFAASVRSHLADPEWSNKAREGQDKDILPCISCMACFEKWDVDGHITCAVNPETGYETQLPPIREDGGHRLVVVLGAGPAGLEAAWMAARRGFRVLLFEKSDRPGGQLLLAGMVPRKEKIQWLLDSLLHRCQQAGVEMHCGHAPTVDELKSCLV